MAPLLLEGFPSKTAFRPHGLDFLPETGELFVVNHAFAMGGERIDVFKVRREARSPSQGHSPTVVAQHALRFTRRLEGMSGWPLGRDWEGIAKVGVPGMILWLACSCGLREAV